MAMSQEQLEIVIKAIDDASSTMKKIQDNSSTMGDKFKKVGKVIAVAGAAAGAAIGAFAIKSVKDFAEAEQASAMLEHAVIGVTKASQGQLKATSDLADELERKGVLDGDAIKVGLAQLSTFGLTNEAVRGLGGSLADLAVNQFGVTASGEQLSDTANMIAKALNGQFGVLEKSGIRFSEAQQKAIEFGTEMEKVAAINEGFAQNLKFTNEIALTTLDGKLAAAGVAFGNLSEKIGGVIAPVVTAFVEKNLLPMIQTVSDSIPTLDELKAGFERIRDSFGTAMSELDSKTHIITDVKDAFYKVWDLVENHLWPSLKELGVQLKPLEPVLLAIGVALGGAFIVLLRESVNLFVKMVEKVTEAAKIFADIATEINKTYVPAINDFIAQWQAIIDPIERVINKFIDLKKVAKEAFDIAKNGLGAGIGSMVPIIGPLLGPSIPGKASGGPVSNGKPYVVGEEGPELFVPKQSGSIVPNGAMSISVMEGSNIVVRNDGDIQAISRAVVGEISQLLQGQRNGLATSM